MSQLNYVTAMINVGYEEIDKKESPVVWGRKRKVLYLNKGDMYAMVDQHGHFVHWKHPEETEKVKMRYEYVKEPKVKPMQSAWATQIEEKYYK